MAALSLIPCLHSNLLPCLYRACLYRGLTRICGIRITCAVATSATGPDIAAGFPGTQMPVEALRIDRVVPPDVTISWPEINVVLV
ncbi:MAG: hypothetical protein L0Y57_10455 [Beijerinckiaceae bacterium]|nr:hypothetical protein [Beijerinckiaceae bacterium]